MPARAAGATGRSRRGSDAKSRIPSARGASSSRSRSRTYCGGVASADQVGEPYRVAGIGNALVPNVSAVYGIEDVRAYEAMTLSRLRDTFPLWCVPQGVWFNRVDDATRPFLSFLNVRWLLTELP